MKLSFVMPAYKRRYLREAVESILAQTMKDFELVIVDDASPEKLDEVVAEFHDPRLTFVRNERNLGRENLVANWNRAVELAHCDYCVVASDDDIYAPEYVGKMLELVERHPSVNVFHCRTGIIDGKGQCYKIGEKRPEMESVADLMYARGVKRCLQTAPEFMFKTAALKRIGGFINFPAAWYSDDATWFALAKENGLAFCDELMFYWRYSGENISSKFDSTGKKIDAAEAYKAWLREFVASITPQSKEDRLALDFVKANINESVDQQSLFDLDDTKLVAWLKIMASRRVPVRLRLRSIRNRIRKIVAI